MNKLDDLYFCSNDVELPRCTIPPKGCEDCPNKHRLFPTPEQFKEEYGEDVPDDMAVYCFTFDGAGYSWVSGDYKWAKTYKSDTEPVVCACTPFVPVDDYDTRKSIEVITEKIGQGQEKPK